MYLGEYPWLLQLRGVPVATAAIVATVVGNGSVGVAVIGHSTWISSAYVAAAVAVVAAAAMMVLPTAAGPGSGGNDRSQHYYVVVIAWVDVGGVQDCSRCRHSPLAQ
jgi:hypothetical protein